MNAPADDHDRQRAFTDRLIAELRHRADQVRLRPTTIFVGGGTPTLLEAEHWRRLLDVIGELGALEQVREFTVEANPETVGLDLMRVLADAGVNRVSLGAQSFHPGLLETLERWHDPASVARAVNVCHEVGIFNLNLDLIFAIPGQTERLLDADLDAALALEPTHLSCYSLIFEPHTPLHQKMAMGRIAPMAEDTQRTMYERVLDRLAAGGFEQYEISNWARSSPSADWRCQHNLAYWLNRNWLGMGPSAASHIDGTRWKNEAHLGHYISNKPEPPVVDVESLDSDARIGEQLMLMLRLREGVPIDWINANVPTDHPRRRTMDEMVALGMLERTAAHLRLTRRGLFVADSIIARLL